MNFKCDIYEMNSSKKINDPLIFPVDLISWKIEDPDITGSEYTNSYNTILGNVSQGRHKLTVEFRMTGNHEDIEEKSERFASKCRKCKIKRKYDRFYHYCYLSSRVITWYGWNEIHIQLVFKDDMCLPDVSYKMESDESSFNIKCANDSACSILIKAKEDLSNYDIGVSYYDVNGIYHSDTIRVSYLKKDEVLKIDSFVYKITVDEENYKKYVNLLDFPQVYEKLKSSADITKADVTFVVRGRY